jgi:hypothetical protein
MKEWNVTRTKIKGYHALKLRCPSCGNASYVSRVWAEHRTLEKSDGQHVTIIGRPCTYCFKTFGVPADA